jgi:pilus assembly protein CpaF
VSVLAKGLLLGPAPGCSRTAGALSLTGTNLSYSPFVDATLGDGSRLHVVIPDITRRHWAVNIRRFVLRAHPLGELVRLGTMSGQCARFLEAAVVTGLNIVVAGATQSGKTTTLNCLAAAIPPGNG